MASEDNVQLRTLSPRPNKRIEPSPARDALKGNLRADEADLGLKKRKSWFGSMRDVFHKGALQAKAAVDSMRGEQGKHEDETKPMMEANNKSPYHSSVTPEPRESLDSAASTTPLKSHTFSPQLNRRRTFSPREAVSSLRHHLPGHGSRSKRGSVYNIAGRTSTDASGIPGPEQFTETKGRDSDEIDQHRRMSSVASSLVGSIRGLRRRPTKSKATTSLEPTGPEDAAEEVPLPSSPINIPSAAPVLGLDLGQPGMNFMPSDLPGGAPNVRDRELLKLQDPANFAIDGAMARYSSLPLVPDEVKMQYTHPAIRQRPATPREMLLTLPSENTKLSPPGAPVTPMPGTNLTMEMDGASDSASSGKKSRVFERSVTPTTVKDRKELRTMCSLDAIAEACTKKGRKDSAVEACETVREERHDRPSAAEHDVSPNSNPFSPCVSIPSASTMSKCPSDMPELERQKSTDSNLYRFGGLGVNAGTHRSTTPMFVEDPFDDSHVATHGPPSPTRSVRLPLRFKFKGPSDESAATVEIPLSPTPVADQHDLLPGAQYTFESPTKSPAPFGEKSDGQRLQRNYAVPQNLSDIDQRPQSSLSPEHTEVFSDDDTMNRAQSLCNSDVVYPTYEELFDAEVSEDGMSPHNGPIEGPPIWHGDSSPGRSPGKSTWKAGLGADGFKFSIDTWRPGLQPIPDPQPQTTPSRRAMDVTIDSVSVDEAFETPIGSRASTKSGRTPSMCNKLELDARRSERNMRYNALQQEQARLDQQQKKSSSPVRMHARFILGGSSGDLDPNEAQYYPDYPAAYVEGTPGGSDKLPIRINSEDSMTMSLRSASDNMEKLRALLGEIDSDGDNSHEDTEIMDAFTTAATSSPRSKHPFGRKDRAIRSDSPSPEPTASHPLPATPILDPFRFSPTAAHDNASPNRFAALGVGVDLVSSPISDDTTTAADLPIAYEQHHKHHSKDDRICSGDTLDQTLDMLSSPDSGYKADDSSEVQTTPGCGSTGKQIPRRYRSQSARKGRKALAEITGNSVS